MIHRQEHHTQGIACVRTSEAPQTQAQCESSSTLLQPDVLGAPRMLEREAAAGRAQHLPWDDALPESSKTKGIQRRQARTSWQSNTHHMQEDVMKKRMS